MPCKCWPLIAAFVFSLSVAAQTTQTVPPDSSRPAAVPSQPPPVVAPPAASGEGSQGIPEAVPVSPSVKGKTPKSGKENSGENAPAEKEDNDQPIKATQAENAVLWHDPGNIAALNLFYGQGGEKGQPVPPFVFESEDMNGTNPKFDAKDAKGRTWRVKLGDEARPEVVASRLLWATGYFVEDDYVLSKADVQGLKMKRGGNRIHGDHITEARFARKPSGQKKIGIWQWKENPFTGSREYNGLRVMMAVMNNWDLKDVNNAVFFDKKSGQEIFLTSDVGATFGTNGLSFTVSRSKGKVGNYEKSKFITRLTDTDVDFGTPKPPTGLLLETLGVETREYIMRKGFEWIGDNIPRKDAKWIGSLLGQLSHQQLVDAFRAGHFPPDQVEQYVDIVEGRIRELQEL